MGLTKEDIEKYILNLIRKKEVKEAFKAFHRYFSDTNPAELEYIKKIYLEISKQNLHEDNYNFLKEISGWYTDNADFDSIVENTTRIYVNSLLLKASNMLYERIVKKKSFDKSLQRHEASIKESLRIQNEKQLSDLLLKSKETYKLAIQLSPNNSQAYKGLIECCKLENNEKEEEEVLKKYNEIFNQKEKDEKTANDENNAVEATNKNSNLSEVFEKLSSLYTERKHLELLDEIAELEKNQNMNAELFILKAKALAELKRFKASNIALYHAKQLISSVRELEEAQNAISKIKFDLCMKAGNRYLKKGVQMGATLGKRNFELSMIYFNKAFSINPDNLDLLDNTYTALKYLDDKEKALKIKGFIYSLDPKFITSYEQQFNKTLCFIATFAYKEHPYIVNEFRWFRREFLLNNKIGKRINSLYVLISPRITKLANDNKYLKLLFQIILFLPLIAVELLKLIKTYLSQVKLYV